MAQVVMGITDTKTVTVCPKEYREISDILPQGERISEVMELTLNKAEIKRAMSNAVVKEGETVLNEKNYFLKEESEEVVEEGTENTIPEETPENPEGTNPDGGEGTTTEDETQDPGTIDPEPTVDPE